MAAEFNCHPRRNAAICAHFALAWCRLALRLPDRNYTHMRNSWCNATALWVRLRCLFSSAAAAAAAASSVLQICVHCRLFLPLQRLSCHARVPAHHGLIRGGRRRDHPFHKLSIGLLVLLVYVLAECLWSVGICKAGGHLASLKPRYLVHCHGGDLKWMLIRAEDLECHSRAAVWPDNAGVELLLDVLLCVSPSFDTGEEYYLACLNALH